MGFIERLKKLIKVGYSGKPEGEEYTLDELRLIIRDHMASATYEWMLAGENYYRIENDVLWEPIRDELKHNANRRLAHSFYHNLVDEKVSYVFAKEPILECEDESYLARVTELLGDQFQPLIEAMGYEATNKIIGWLQPYIDENGELRWYEHDALEIIPLWADKKQRKLTHVLRFYNVPKYNAKARKYVDLQKIELIGTQVTQQWLENEKGEFERLEDIPHIAQGDKLLNWGMVPMVPFFNNREEIPDIKLVKTLIDAYDATRTESENFIEDIRNFVYVLYGYEGEDLDEFLAKLRKYRTIKMGSDGKLESLKADMNLDNVAGHYTQLKKDIYEEAQGVLRDISAIGSNPTNLALKFLYSGLDLKASKIESQFKQAFDRMLEFVEIYMASRGEAVSDKKVFITFNKDLVMNEVEYIENINKSSDLSLETRLRMHPWVTDVNAELERLKAEEDERLLAEKDVDYGQNAQE